MRTILSNAGTWAAGDPFWPTRNPWGFTRSLSSGRRLNLPPGPVGRPFVGVLPEMRADPFEYPRYLHRKYGDIVRMPYPMYDVILLNHPNYVAQTMNNPETEYSFAGPLLKVLPSFFKMTPGMEGEEYQTRRKLVMPMFSQASLQEMSNTMARLLAEQIDRWDAYVDTGIEIDLQESIAKSSLFAFMKIMCSHDMDDETADQFCHDFPIIMKFLSSLWLYEPYPSGFVPAFRRTMSWMGDRINERLADPDPPQDMLQVLVDQRDNPAAGFNEQSLRMELLTLIAGGFETVVASTSWTLGLLPSNPEAQQRLFAEVDQLGGALPTYDDLARLRWAKACFDEGQRLQGHPFMQRYAMRDDVIDGYHIRAGTLTAVSFYTMHRDERWWGLDPDAYDPMRFYDLSQVAQRPNLSFIPFGSGQHRCLGSAMGYMNGQFLLALIHQRYRLHLRPGWSPEHAVTFSVPVKGGLPVTLTRASRPNVGAIHNSGPFEHSADAAAGCPIHVSKGSTP